MKKFTNRNLIRMAIVCIAIGLGSCQKDAVEVSSNKQGQEAVKIQDGVRISSIPKGNLLLEDVAKIVAKSLNEKSFREKVKEEAQKRFDGDYDILLSEFIKSRDKQGNSIKGILVKSAKANNISEELEKYHQILPKINIGVPVNIDEWNTDNYVPLVAIRGLDYDEASTKEIKAFDKDGKIHWIDATKEPTVPVVVIGMNERVVIDEKGSFSLKHNQARFEPGNKSSGGRTAGILSDNCYFQDKAWIYIYSMKFTGNWGAKYEGWPAGAPEIDVRVFSPKSTNNFADLQEVRKLNDLEPNKRSDINEKWWICNQSIIAWDKALYGQTLLFDFTEDDAEAASDKPITIAAKFKISDILSIDLSTSFQIKTVDEHIGTMPVYQCAAPPKSDDGYYYDVNQYFYFELIN